MVSTRPTSDMLKKMGLKPGRNSIEFIVESYAQVKLSFLCSAYDTYFPLQFFYL